MSLIETKAHTLKSGVSILVRSARSSDAEALLNFVFAILSEATNSVVTQPDEFRLSVEQEAAWIQEHEVSAGKVLLVVEAAGQLIGTLNFENEPRLRLAHQGELGVSIHPAWRDQGIGRILLEALIAWAELDPLIEKLNLRVFATNERAIHLYQSLGFREEGRFTRHIKFAEGRYVDVISMALFVLK